jgi:hypothetical protein
MIDSAMKGPQLPVHTCDSVMHVLHLLQHTRTIGTFLWPQAWSLTPLPERAAGFEPEVL